jgi:hypothetical protein
MGLMIQTCCGSQANQSAAAVLIRTSAAAAGYHQSNSHRIIGVSIQLSKHYDQKIHALKGLTGIHCAPQAASAKEKAS